MEYFDTLGVAYLALVLVGCYGQLKFVICSMSPVEKSSCTMEYCDWSGDVY